MVQVLIGIKPELKLESPVGSWMRGIPKAAVV